MKTIVFAITLTLSVGASAQNTRANELCRSAGTVKIVKEIFHENYVPAITGKPIEATLFQSATTIEKIVPIDWNDSLKRVTCQAVLTVDASAGLDRAVDQAVQMSSARSPGILLGLPKSFSGPQDKRRYNVPITYTSQSTTGKELYASVGRPTELESIMTFGILKALQDKTSKPQAPVPVAEAPASRSQQDDEGKMLAVKTVPTPVKDADPLSAESTQYEVADKALNAAYKKAMARLDGDDKAKLRTAQRAWIKKRDNECDALMGAARTISCQIDWTNTRTGELDRL